MALFLALKVVMERYEIVKDIGSGNFGVAKLVKDKSSGELFAVKYIDRGQKVLLLLSSEPWGFTLLESASFFFFLCRMVIQKIFAD